MSRIGYLVIVAFALVGSARSVSTQETPIALQSRWTVDSLNAHWEAVRADEDGLTAPNASFPWDFEMRVVGLGTVVEREFTGLNECAGDSMFTAYTDRGNVTVNGYGVQTYVLAETFSFENGVTYSMSQDEVVAILGEPMRRRDDVMTFAVRVYDDDGYNENIRMFFRDEKLVFVWLISTRLC